MTKFMLQFWPKLAIFFVKILLFDNFSKIVAFYGKNSPIRYNVAAVHLAETVNLMHRTFQRVGGRRPKGVLKVEN